MSAVTRLRASIRELVMSGDPDAEKTIRRWSGLLNDLQIEKHYGPGPHPGTGTPQKVHGGSADGGLLVSSFRRPTLEEAQADPMWQEEFGDVPSFEQIHLVNGREVTVRWRGRTQAQVDVLNDSNHVALPIDTELHPEVREALEGIPDEVWELARHPKVVVQNGSEIFGVSYDPFDPLERRDLAKGLGVYGFKPPEGTTDTVLLPDGQHVLYLSSAAFRSDLKATFGPDVGKHILIHELAHAITIPDLWDNPGLDAQFFRTAMHATGAGFEENAPSSIAYGDNDPDPWSYPRQVSMNSPPALGTEFVAEAFAHMARGKRNVVEDTDQFVAEITNFDPGIIDITDYLDDYFTGGEVLLTKAARVTVFPDGQCGTPALLEALTPTE